MELITPLFGGGARARVPDATLPIRGTAIRGHLQFWWRATTGAALTGTELFDRHSDLWGTTDRPGQVEIEVREVKHTAVERQIDRQLSYVLFPFQEKDDKPANKDDKPANFVEICSFCLRVRCKPRAEQEVDAAIRAWVNFGGLGARTRRGCGSLFCIDFAPKSMRELLTELPPRSQLLAGPELAAPEAAWKQAIWLLRDFRQGEGFARNRGGGTTPGRSRWPEPETIRQTTRSRLAQHARMPNIPDNAFPRAEFGMPIVFHFKDERRGDPRDTVLFASAGGVEKRERMASPLILKALKLGNGKAVPIILRLDRPPLTGVELRNSEKLLLRSFPADAIRSPRLAQYPNSPLKDTTSGSALDAFLRYAESRGFQKVIR